MSGLKCVVMTQVRHHCNISRCSIHSVRHTPFMVKGTCLMRIGGNWLFSRFPAMQWGGHKIDLTKGALASLPHHCDITTDHCNSYPNFLEGRVT